MSDSLSFIIIHLIYSFLSDWLKSPLQILHDQVALTEFGRVCHFRENDFSKTGQEVALT